EDGGGEERDRGPPVPRANGPYLRHIRAGGSGTGRQSSSSPPSSPSPPSPESEPSSHATADRSPRHDRDANASGPLETATLAGTTCGGVAPAKPPGPRVTPIAAIARASVRAARWMSVMGLVIRISFRCSLSVQRSRRSIPSHDSLHGRAGP